MLPTDTCWSLTRAKTQKVTFTRIKSKLIYIKPILQINLKKYVILAVIGSNLFVGQNIKPTNKSHKTQLNNPK